jgi:hypothetical protein
MVGIPAALDLRHAVASRPLVGDVRAADLVEHEEAFLGGRVRAILVRLADRDPSTEGRTAALLPWRSRSASASGCRRAGCVSSRWAVCCTTSASCRCPTRSSTSPAGWPTPIRRDPAPSRAGCELLTKLGALPPLVLDLVESHHERLDGRS